MCPCGGGVGYPKVKEAPTPLFKCPPGSQSEEAPPTVVAGIRRSKRRGGHRDLVAAASVVPIPRRPERQRGGLDDSNSKAATSPTERGPQ